jgi:hypothetical protein
MWQLLIKSTTFFFAFGPSGNVLGPPEDTFLSLTECQAKAPALIETLRQRNPDWGDIEWWCDKSIPAQLPLTTHRTDLERPQ